MNGPIATVRAVPLANRFFVGFEDAVRGDFHDLLRRLGERLGRAAR